MLLSYTVANHYGKGVLRFGDTRERKTAEMTVFSSVGEMPTQIKGCQFQTFPNLFKSRRFRPLHGEQNVQAIRRNPKTGLHTE